MELWFFSWFNPRERLGAFHFCFGFVGTAVGGTGDGTVGQSLFKGRNIEILSSSTRHASFVALNHHSCSPLQPQPPLTPVSPAAEPQSVSCSAAWCWEVLNPPQTCYLLRIQEGRVAPGFDALWNRNLLFLCGQWKTLFGLLFTRSWGKIMVFLDTQTVLG